jgi:hypothetical protein
VFYADCHDGLGGDAEVEPARFQKHDELRLYFFVRLSSMQPKHEEITSSSLHDELNILIREDVTTHGCFETANTSMYYI